MDSIRERYYSDSENELIRCKIYSGLLKKYGRKINFNFINAFLKLNKYIDF